MSKARRYSQSDYPMPLRVPEGTEYLVATRVEEIWEALAAGRAAYVHSCNGRAFVWKEEGVYRVDHFFVGPPNELDFDSEEAAVDYAGNLCE